MDNGLSLFQVERVVNLVAVLILIVMDNGLSPLFLGGNTFPAGEVLILIVMDNGLSHKLSKFIGRTFTKS